MSKFDLNKELEELAYPDMFKAGLKYYIQKRAIKINSKKDLENIVNEYSGLKIGV